MCGRGLLLVLFLTLLNFILPFSLFYFTLIYSALLYFYSYLIYLISTQLIFYIQPKNITYLSSYTHYSIIQFLYSSYQMWRNCCFQFICSNYTHSNRIFWSVCVRVCLCMCFWVCVRVFVHVCVCVCMSAHMPFKCSPSEFQEFR